MIPATWKKATIGELCQMVKGKSPTMKTKSGEYPLVTMGEEHKTADSYQLDTEAVCVPMISSFGHGKAGLKRVHYIKGKFALSNILMALVVKEPRELSTKYLALYLQTFKDQLIVPLQTGAANMSLRPEKLAGVQVSFPSMKEQERIIQQIEDANLLQDLREQASQKTSLIIPAYFHQLIGNPLSNPSKWQKLKLSKVCQIIRGIGFKPSDKSSDKDLNSIACLRTKNIQDNLYLDDLIYIPRSLVRNPLQIIKNGDVLISTANSKELVGKCCLVENLNFPATLGAFITNLRCDESQIMPIFFYSWINLQEIQTIIRSYARQTTNIANLPTSKIQNMDIPVPPMDVQIEFSEFVSKVHQIQMYQVESGIKLKNTYNAFLSYSFGNIL